MGRAARADFGRARGHGRDERGDPGDLLSMVGLRKQLGGAVVWEAGLVRARRTGKNPSCTATSSFTTASITSSCAVASGAGSGCLPSSIVLRRNFITMAVTNDQWLSCPSPAAPLSRSNLLVMIAKH